MRECAAEKEVDAIKLNFLHTHKSTPDQFIINLYHKGPMTGILWELKKFLERTVSYYFVTRT